MSHTRIHKQIFNFEFISGVLIILFMATVAILAAQIASPSGNNPYFIPKDGFNHVPKPPNADHLLGTLPGQYDIFYGLVWGTRTAFLISLVVVIGRVLVGVTIGLISGFTGGQIDAILMRLTDGFMAFPLVAILTVTLALVGQTDMDNSYQETTIFRSKMELTMLYTLIAFGWMQYARVIRANILAERDKEYVYAAITIGASNQRILFRHLLPNSLQGLFVLASSEVGFVITLVSSFYFIGLAGNRYGNLPAEWGQMLFTAKDWVVGASSNVAENWYTFVPVSLAIILYSAGWNLLGDGLRRILDPRYR